MWIRVSDNAGNVQWVNGDHIRRLRQVQGVGKRWTEVHFDQSQWITVTDEADEIVGRLL